MARSKSMGLFAMIVLLVLVVAVLPVIVNYFGYVSGFVDMEDEDLYPEKFTDIPGSQMSSYIPDSNTDYMCRSPNGGSEPCPAGHFCDGTTQSCVPTYVGGTVPSTGYYS